MESLDNFISNASKILNYPCLYSQLLELTSREWDVLIAIADDVPNAEIAEKLSLTEKSVGNYRTRIGHKLNLAGIHNLARFARKHAIELHLWHERCCWRLK